MTRITCNVHANARTKIAVEPLISANRVINTVLFDDLCIFAEAPELRRLADAITARLAVIDAEAMQVAA